MTPRQIALKCAEIAENCSGAYATRNALRAFAATLPDEPAVPEGWKLVPVEPSTNMMKVGIYAFNEGTLAAHHLNGLSQLERAYRAMLAAAPEPGNDIENESDRRVLKGDSNG